MFHQIHFTINEETNLVSVSGGTVYNNNIKGIIFAITICVIL